jgi:hypothetical protein
MPVLLDKLLFIHIPKTGGASIEAALGEFDPKRPSVMNHARRLATWAATNLNSQRISALHGHASITLSPQHLTLNEIISLGLLSLDEIYKEFTCFTVIRNPYSRVISQWRTHNRIRSYPDINKFIREWLFNPRLKKSQDDMAHSRPQSAFLRLDPFYISAYSAPPSIYKLRFEYLDTDYRNFLKSNIDDFIPLPHRGKSQGPRLDYRNLLNDESRSLIERYYRDDLDEFGYEW